MQFELSQPHRIAFPRIDTVFDPHDHSDPTLFVHKNAPEDFGGYMVEIINLSPNMSLFNDFILVLVHTDLRVS